MAENAAKKAKRWVWDFYPLDKGTWGNREEEVPEGTPAGKPFQVTRYRQGGRISFLGSDAPPIRLRSTPVPRAAYLPTDDDLAFLRAAYPKEDPYRPEWRNVRDEIVAAGRNPDDPPKMSAPALLRSLARAKGIPFGEEADSAPQAAQAPAQAAPSRQGDPLGDGAQNSPPDEAEGPAAVAERIGRLIADMHIVATPRFFCAGGNGPTKEEEEKSQREEAEFQAVRRRAISEGKAIAAALVSLGEGAAAVLGMVNAIEEDDFERTAKNWPDAKVSLQEAAIRLRQRKEGDGLRQGKGAAGVAQGGPAPEGQAEAYGSSPGGRGNTGLREAPCARENGLEKSSSAGAHSPDSPLENKGETPSQVRTPGAQVRRTLGDVRKSATTLADEIQDKAEGAPLPALYLAAAYTEQAFRLAVGAAQWTRGGKAPDVAEFLRTFAELHEYGRRAREVLEGRDKGKVWEHWPAAPGTVYCWKADNSALAVAYAFARMIESEVFCNCPVSYNALSLPCDTPGFSEWRDKAVAGIAANSLPPLADWPRWMIHRDSQALLCKLGAEYDQAFRHALAGQERPAESLARHAPGRPAEDPGGPAAVADLIQRLIAQCEDLLEGLEVGPPVVGIPSAPFDWPREEDNRFERSRGEAIETVKALAPALVAVGEIDGATAAHRLCNALARNGREARPLWPMVKVVLQLAEDRLRLGSGATMHGAFKAEDLAPPLAASGATAAQEAVLPERVRVAWGQYSRAEEALSGERKGKPRDRECYAWAKAHSDGDALPDSPTWQRYVREARLHYGRQKNTPRAGREHGRSILPAEEAEPPKADEAD